MKKGIVTLLVGLSVCTFCVMPVVAEEAGCPHPFNDRKDYQGDVHRWNDEQHCVGREIGYTCTRCGATVIEEGPSWENHSFEVDWSSRLEHGYGLVSYDQRCTECGYENSLYVQE